MADIWTLPSFGYYGKYCSKNLYTSFLVNICVQFGFRGTGVNFLGIARPLSYFIINILRNFQTDFLNNCDILYFHKQQMRISMFPHPCQNFLPNLIVVYICISLIITNVEYFFIYHFYVFFNEISVQVLCPFFIQFICFLFIFAIELSKFYIFLYKYFIDNMICKY